MSKVTNIFHIAGNYIAEMKVHNDIHDNPNSTIYATAHEAPQKEHTAQAGEETTPVQERKPAEGAFPFLTSKCIRERRAEAVEAEIRAACKGTAEALWRTLWNNGNLGLVDVEYIDATTLFRAIEKWYGKLPYKERNFRDARAKR